MTFERLLEIMALLRERCPWDKKQTRESLTPYIIEEAYELVEAIESGDAGRVREELGDLLLQVVFQSRIAEEAGEFTAYDVIEAIGGKMVHRHPHVFGSMTCETPEEVVEQWEERKKEEGKLRSSILEGIPGGMPALLRAHRLQSRAAKVGFDWPDLSGVLGKLDEEIGEFKEALDTHDPARVEDELGDVLFALVNVSRFVEVNPEDALRKTIDRFIARFRHIEMAAESAGVPLREMTLDEMDRLWDEAKKLERG
jgi:tetrapyrrole methylase family protein/MazG family protein